MASGDQQDIRAKWHRGVVVTIFQDKNFGFIRPQGDIPTVQMNQRVFFHKSKASWQIQQNDLVEFCLDASKHSKPGKPAVCALRQIAPDGTVIHDEVRRTRPQKPSVVPSAAAAAPTLSSSSDESSSTVPPARLRRPSSPSSSSDTADSEEEEAEEFEVIPQNSTKVQLKRKRMHDQMTHQRRTGRIALVKDSYGFISRDSIKPPVVECKLHGDLFFPQSSCHSGHLLLKDGDKVSLYVRAAKTPEGKPSAHDVRLLKCSRDAVVLEEYIVSLLRKAREDTDVAQMAKKLEHIGIAVMCIPVWECIGRCVDLQNEVVEQLLELVITLGKLESLKENLVTLLEALLKSRLFSQHNSPFLRYVQSVAESKLGCQLQLIYDLVLLIFRQVPKSSRQLVALVKPLVSAETKSCENFLYTLLRQSVKSSLGDIENMEWDELPLVPTVEELTSGKLEAYSSLQQVMEKGPYPSPEVYLDTYFRLLRVDCFSALAKGVTELLEGRLDSRDMNVYHGIHLAGIHLTGSGNGLSIGLFVTPQRKVNWDQSSNLMFGNLLCISVSGTFRDPIWATVVSRELLQKHGIVVVELCSENNAHSDSETVLHLYFAGPLTVMVESPTYYRAYQPVLRALQTMDPQQLVFQEELVNCQAGGMPNNIGAGTTFNTGIIYTGSSQNTNVVCFSLDETSLGPTTLDASQETAVKECFRNRISIVQGPPGTGKTFVGIKVVQLLLSMSTPLRSPILILTYKNHSLDEFLKDLLKIFPNGVARVGGRSQEKELAACSLNELKRQKEFRMSEAVFKQIMFFRNEMDRLKQEISDAFDVLNQQRYFSVESVLQCFSDEQLIEFLKNCNWHKTKLKPFKNDKEKGFICVSKTITLKSVELLLVQCSNAGGIHKVITGESSDEEHKKLPGRMFKLLEAALKLWLPHESSFKAYERSFVGQGVVLGKYEQTAKVGVSDGEVLMAERDVDELMKERLATVLSKQANADQILEEMKRFTDIEEGKGHLLNIAKELSGKVPVNQLLGIRNLWDLEERDKIQLVQCILHRSFEEAGKHFEHLFSEYQKVYRAKDELEDQHKANVLRRMKIVGMTVTGANIYRGLVAQMKPAVILVEEAAEVLEPQLVSVMGSWVEHLIMIGDHKQLRPSVENYILSREYHLDISMMERLINNGLSYATLTMQNRMRPEFAELLLDIYPRLQSNLGRVLSNEKASCIGPAMYFWDHNEPETSERSYINTVEVERAVRLALFLIEQGYNPWQITILSPYLGQVRLIRQKVKAVEKEYAELFAQYKPEVDIKKDKELEKKGKEADKEANAADAATAKAAAAAAVAAAAERCIKVHTVDLYQGDENDFVIVSLVRSNDRGEIGFLKLLNRRCVAQSRARCGLYFIGNRNTFLRHSLWNSLIEKLAKQNYVGPTITLNCPTHPDQTRLLVTSHEQIPVRQQFCRVICSCLKSCQLHICMKTCQPRHSHAICRDIVKFTFPECKHGGERECYRDESKEVCQAEVFMTFKTCGHSGYKKCFQEEDKIRCGEPCTKILGCTHPCEKTCGEECDQNSCSICKRIREEEAKKRREAERKLRKEVRQQAHEKLERLREQKPEEGVHRQELSSEDDTAAEYYGVEDKVKKYVQPGHNWFPRITHIEKVTNVKLEMAWLEAQTEVRDPTRFELKFHGTTAMAVESIIKNGFVLPRKRHQMYGPGIYFASDSSKSAQACYTKDSKMLLLCDVLLGRSMTVDCAMKDMSLDRLKSKGFDSLFARRNTREIGGVEYDEFVVYDPKQAIPRYIIHYEDMDCCSLSTAAEQTLVNQLSTAMVHHNIKPPKRALNMDELETQFCIAESQFLRLVNRTPQRFQVESIDYYLNPPLLRKFSAMQAVMATKYPNGAEESKFILAFHGTTIDNIQSIVLSNFDLSKLSSGSGDRGYYGAGIYFSEFPNISIQYGNTGRLLLCRVLPGKSFDCKNRMDGATLVNDHDSHRFQADQDGRGQELVIFDADQILPCYVINYKPA